MNKLTELLHSWQYDPEKNTRILKVPNGKEIFQVRFFNAGFDGIIQTPVDIVSKETGHNLYETRGCNITEGQDELTDILNNWDEPEPERRVMEQDYREILQQKRRMIVTNIPCPINMDLVGIQQMYLDGRPDGKKPYDHYFVLDFYKKALENYNSLVKTGEGFKIGRDVCKELFDESILLSLRYLYLFVNKIDKRHEYERAGRDIKRDKELYKFVIEYAEDEQDKTYLKRWWPCVLRMDGLVRSMDAKSKKEDDLAIDIIQETIMDVRALSEVNDYDFYNERRITKDTLRRHLEYLRINLPFKEKKINEVKKELETMDDSNPIEENLKIMEEYSSKIERIWELENEMDIAIKKENYERCAVIKENLEKLKKEINEK